MLSIFKSTTVTLLAREAKFDASNPQNPIVIEGDRKGFIIWVLKLLRLVDPSFRLEVKDDKIFTCTGKKHYTYMPVSLLSSYSVGFSTKKYLIVLALISALPAVIFLVISIAEPDEGFLLASLLLGGMSFILYRLYKRSGALTVSMNLYNGEGSVNIRIQSGLTGIKLDKELVQQALDASAIAAKNSTHFK